MSSSHRAVVVTGRTKMHLIHLLQRASPALIVLLPLTILIIHRVTLREAIIFPSRDTLGETRPCTFPNPFPHLNCSQVVHHGTPDLHAARHSFRDGRGEYSRLQFPSTNSYVNILYTRGGHYRSGDIHLCTQVNFIISGSVQRTTLEITQKKNDSCCSEVVRRFMQGDVVYTPPGVPHLFYFEVDSLMTEHWMHIQNGSHCEFEAWLYTPFRKRIPKDALTREG